MDYDFTTVNEVYKFQFLPSFSPLPSVVSVIDDLPSIPSTINDLSHIEPKSYVRFFCGRTVVQITVLSAVAFVIYFVATKIIQIFKNRNVAWKQAEAAKQEKAQEAKRVFLRDSAELAIVEETKRASLGQIEEQRRSSLEGLQGLLGQLHETYNAEIAARAELVRGFAKGITEERERFALEQQEEASRGVVAQIQTQFHSSLQCLQGLFGQLHETYNTESAERAELARDFADKQARMSLEQQEEESRSVVAQIQTQFHSSLQSLQGLLGQLHETYNTESAERAELARDFAKGITEKRELVALEQQEEESRSVVAQIQAQFHSSLQDLQGLLGQLYETYNTESAERAELARDFADKQARMSLEQQEEESRSVVAQIQAQFHSSLQDLQGLLGQLHETYNAETFARAVIEQREDAVQNRILRLKELYSIEHAERTALEERFGVEVARERERIVIAGVWDAMKKWVDQVGTEHRVAMQGAEEAQRDLKAQLFTVILKNKKARAEEEVLLRESDLAYINKETELRQLAVKTSRLFRSRSGSQERLVVRREWRMPRLLVARPGMAHAETPKSLGPSLDRASGTSVDENFGLAGLFESGSSGIVRSSEDLVDRVDAIVSVSLFEALESMQAWLNSVQEASRREIEKMESTEGALRIQLFEAALQGEKDRVKADVLLRERDRAYIDIETKLRYVAVEMSRFLKPLKWKRPVFRQLASRVIRQPGCIPQSLGRDSTQRGTVVRGSVKRGLSQHSSSMINRIGLSRGLKVPSLERALSPEPIAPQWDSSRAAYADEEESPRPRTPRLETQGAAPGSFFDAASEQTIQDEISSNISDVLSNLSAVGVHRISARGRALLLAQGKLGEVLVRKNTKGEHFVQVGKAVYEVSLKGKRFHEGEPLLWVKQDNEVRSMALKGSNRIVHFKRNDDINTLCSKR